MSSQTVGVTTYENEIKTIAFKFYFRVTSFCMTATNKKTLILFQFVVDYVYVFSDLILLYFIFLFQRIFNVLSKKLRSVLQHFKVLPSC